MYTELMSWASPANWLLSNWKTGKCCSTKCLTTDTSDVRTQYCDAGVVGVAGGQGARGGSGSTARAQKSACAGVGARQ